MTELRDFLFVDTKMLDRYVEQLSSLETEDRSRSSKLGISLMGPKADYNTSSRFRPKTTTEKIDELITFLRQKKMLGSARLKEMSDKPVPFFLEKMKARKVILPTKLLAAAPGVKDLAIWVSDPDPEGLISDERAWRQSSESFLFLTEMHLDQSSFETVYSGCSALQAIANFADDRALINFAEGEPLGRGSYAHPVDKLAALGATIGDERTITCLYRIRYMTDEQCFSKTDITYRVSDILGYPIYIAQDLMP